MNWSSVFCMFGMALTRPSMTMQSTSGMDVFAHVCGQKAKGAHFEQLLWQYSAIWQEKFLCLSIMTQFLDCCFGNYHTTDPTGMVGSIILVLLEISLAFQQWKSFENPLRIDKVIAMSLVYYFFGTQCMYVLKPAVFDLFSCNTYIECIVCTLHLYSRNCWVSDSITAEYLFLWVLVAVVLSLLLNVLVLFKIFAAS